jgi:GntR family transcriptional regulator
VPEWTDFPDGTALLVRRRVRYVDGRAYSISDSYYPRDLVGDSALAEPADITIGARHLLGEMGAGLHHHRDTIECRRPHDREVQVLGIASGLFVLAHTRISYTEDDRPVRLLASVLPSDRWRLTYEVR